MQHIDICIITQLHPSSNPRLVKEADALTEAGYSVTVIAPDFSASWRQADREFENRAWKIVDRPRFGPLAPLSTRIAELARGAAAGLAVKNIGMEHPALVRAAWHPVAPALVAAAKRQRAALYISHYPASLPAAALAAAYHKACYAFDAEDFHPGDVPDLTEHRAQNRMVRLIEGQYLPGCCYITASSPGIADAYFREYRIARPTVVLNTFPKSQAAGSWTAAGSASPSPSIYWFSQTIGGDRGLQAAIRAVAKSRRKPHLFLRGDPAKGIVDELRSIGADNRIIDRLHFLPLAPPHQMVAQAAQYDIGLCGEIGHTPNRRIALTNKQFVYLLAGIPLLMSDIPAHRSFSQFAAGAMELYSVDDADSLARAIDTILDSPDRLASMRVRAWQLGQTRFNWDVEKQTLVGEVERGLGRRAAANVGEADLAAPLA